MWLFWRSGGFLAVGKKWARAPRATPQRSRGRRQWVLDAFVFSLFWRFVHALFWPFLVCSGVFWRLEQNGCPPSQVRMYLRYSRLRVPAKLCFC